MAHPIDPAYVRQKTEGLPGDFKMLIYKMPLVIQK